MLLKLLDNGEPDAPAIVVPDGPRLTYQELREQVRRGAEALAGLGLRRDQAVGMVFENSAEALVLFLAAALAASAAPLNPAYTEAEFRFYLEDVDARALVVPPGAAGAARRALPEGAVLVEAAIAADGRLHLEAEGRRARAADLGEPAGDDVALMLHTSGTTGRPKRAPLRHRNLIASVENTAAHYQLGPGDVSLCVMPLFHVHGLMASALATLRSGGTVVVPAPFNPLSFWAVAGGYQPTWYSAVPTIHKMVLARARGERPPASRSLRFVRSCSSALAPELMAQIEGRLGVPVLEAYGMTEACHQIASNPLPPADRRPGSVGRGTGVQVAVVDDHGVPLPAGTPGEVVIRGPNVIDGYAGNPRANAASFLDGWFRTGDQGMLDADGYLTLVSRIKELINRGGEKISPREIDEVMLRHPAVAEAVAFGVPHPTLGEEVAVAVVLREPATERELLAHCREQLAAFKVPAKLRVVKAIPRTATGKIQRRKVADSLEVGG
ncbi:MAG TPA: acyl--CoA ligase [Actinomycetes bacterium]|jgi:acyl-CoA synthetase (AMP-forming)/AMP-acid ligase II|nr:acyl--CoA ligase [Actinomycetes bacterium]